MHTEQFGMVKLQFYKKSKFYKIIDILCDSVSGTQLPQKMVPSLWDQDEQVRRTHKCMGKICASRLNCQTLRIFQYGGHFTKFVRVSKN